MAKLRPRNPDIVGLWNHNHDELPLGRTTSGTMKVYVDQIGVRYEIEPGDITIARDLLVSIRRGDINASSFGFYRLQDEWSIDLETDQLIRTVQKGEMFDCSPVTFPAYPDADAGLRALMATTMKSGAEVRSFGQADAELRNKVTQIRQQLMQGDCNALSDREWRRNAMLQQQLAQHLVS